MKSCPTLLLLAAVLLPLALPQSLPAQEPAGARGNAGQAADHQRDRRRRPDRVLTNYGHWPAGIPPANIAARQEDLANWDVAATAR